MYDTNYLTNYEAASPDDTMYFFRSYLADKDGALHSPYAKGSLISKDTPMHIGETVHTSKLTPEKLKKGDTQLNLYTPESKTQAILDDNSEHFAGWNSDRYGLSAYGLNDPNLAPIIGSPDIDKKSTLAELKRQNIQGALVQHCLDKNMAAKQIMHKQLGDKLRKTPEYISGSPLQNEYLARMLYEYTKLRPDLQKRFESLGYDMKRIPHKVIADMMRETLTKQPMLGNALHRLLLKKDEGTWLLGNSEAKDLKTWLQHYNPGWSVQVSPSKKYFDYNPKTNDALWDALYAASASNISDPTLTQTAQKYGLRPALYLASAPKKSIVRLQDLYDNHKDLQFDDNEILLSQMTPVRELADYNKFFADNLNKKYYGARAKGASGQDAFYDTFHIDEVPADKIPSDARYKNVYKDMTDWCAKTDKQNNIINACRSKY